MNPLAGIVSMALLLAGTAFPASAAQTEQWTEPVTGMVFSRIPRGCFRMGLAQDAFAEAGDLFRQRIRDEMPEHEVCLDQFWIGQLEVRRGDWRRVMGGDGDAESDALPIANISWTDASLFASKLSELSGGTERFRLPTEAEWEYSCRAGATSAPKVFRSRNELNRHAWYSSQYDFKSTGARVRLLQAGGKKMANAFGLHDMLGNAWEWVADVYHRDAYKRHQLYNPEERSAADTVRRVIRGGGLRTGSELIRCETRAWLPEREPTDTVGFRLVRESRN